MTGNEVREKYLKFFEKRGHKVITPAPLVLKDDPTTLFTSAGMQPLVPNLLGERHPEGKRLVDSQPCFRSQDIEEVGDNRHDTLFEMLGNWSLGDYFKKEQIPWVWELLTKELNLQKEKLFITVFEGNDQLDKDTEAYDTWKSLGVSDENIYFYGDRKNWWSRAGAPSNMPAGEPGGPSSEVFYDFGANLKIHEHSAFNKEKCHPNCDCGRYIEIANSVFVQYKKETDGTLSELKQKNVDFGGGLERMLMAVNNEPDMFRNDLHYPIIQTACKRLGVSYEKDNQTRSSLQVIADHIKAATFLIAGEVTPSNKLQGYVLRRLLRRTAVKMRNLAGKITEQDLIVLVDDVINIYKDTNYFANIDIEKIKLEISNEVSKFSANLEKGIKKIDNIDAKNINAKFAFDLMQSEGFPYEVTEELAKQKGVDLKRKDFDKLLEEHQELSRKSSEKMFKLEK